MTRQIKKSNLHSSKKGYLEIDFSIAIFLFIILLISMFLLYDSSRELESNKLEIVKLNAEARDICSLLINSPGIPNDYEDDVGSLIQPGLREINSQNLSQNKLSVFNNDSLYFGFIERIDFDYFLSVDVIGVASGTSYSSFGVTSGVESIYSKYICYSNYNSEIVKVVVEVWK